MCICFKENKSSGLHEVDFMVRIGVTKLQNLMSKKGGEYWICKLTYHIMNTDSTRERILHACMHVYLSSNLQSSFIVS